VAGALIIARHHLVRIVRSPGLILILLAVPVTLAAIEYAAFGPTVASGRLPPIKILVLDEDKTFLSGAVPQLFTAGPLADMFETSAIAERGAAQGFFQRNEASALVVVPKGFQDAILTGARAELQFAPNPLQTYSPAIAASVLDMMALVGNGLYEQAAAPLRQINELRGGNRSPTGDEIAAIARGLYEAGQRLNGLSAAGNITVTSIRPTGQRDSFGSAPAEFFAYIFPGLVIFAVLFISQALALRLLRDRIRGVDRRVRMTAVAPSAQVAGSFLFMIAGLSILLAVLMLVGAGIFRIHLRNPAALVALGVGFAVFAAALQLAIIGVARDDRSASFMGSGIVLLLSLLGGTFFPAETLPPFLRSVAFVIPNGAAQQGFVDVLAHGLTFSQASARVLTTWAWAIGMLAVGVAALGRRSAAV
jgi:ABC-type multidrug transport system permease subunit